MNKIAPVELFKYDPKWADLFNKEKNKLTDAIGDYVLSIEHIGSTAIPGSIAKPEIDIMIGVEKLVNAEKCIEPLQKIGYVYFPKFEAIIPERRYMRKSEGLIPLVHIHMVELKSDFWRDRILFRDYIRDRPEVVREYNDLKKGLLKRFKGDRKKYSEGKEKFILEIIKKAQLTYRLLGPAETLPCKENVSAVFLVAFKDGKILSAQNERGWDVPGGHLEGDEECLAALKREVLEEAGVEVRDAVPYVVLTSSTSPKVMVFFASNSINLVEFVPSRDAFGRDLLDPEDLLSRYHGDKELLRSIIESGRRRLGLP